MAQEAGADAIDVSAYGNPSKGIAFTEAPLVHEPGGFLNFVKMAKKELTISIIAVGRIELDIAEKGLKNNDFDFLAMGKLLMILSYQIKLFLDKNISYDHVFTAMCV